MFVVGTCDEFISLKGNYSNKYIEYGYEWSLKEFGSLFIYDILVKHKPKRILEFGCGFNLFFSDMCANLGIDYISVDLSNDVLGVGQNDSRFKDVVKHRKNNGHRHINSLLGNLKEDIKSNSIDMIFSISVVEHIADDLMDSIIKDAKRILIPGGKLVNSIDVYPRSRKHLQWHGTCKNNSLDVKSPHYLRWEFDGLNTTFIEQPKIRYTIYNSLNQNNLMKKRIPYNSHFATAIHVAEK